MQLAMGVILLPSTSANNASTALAVDINCNLHCVVFVPTSTFSFVNTPDFQPCSHIPLQLALMEFSYTDQALMNVHAFYSLFSKLPNQFTSGSQNINIIPYDVCLLCFGCVHHFVTYVLISCSRRFRW